MTEEVDIRRDALRNFERPYLSGDSSRKVVSISDIQAELSENKTESTMDTLFSSDPVLVSGRVILKRKAGSIVFATIRSLEADGTTIQLFLSPEYMDEAEITLFKSSVHLGDVLYVTGLLGWSKTNENSLYVGSWEMAAKSLNPFPKAVPNAVTGVLEHQLNGATIHDDPVLHLLTSAEHRNNIMVRARTIKTLRDYFVSNGFTEVDTPILSTHAGGASATRFSTHGEAVNEDMYLRVAPELYLKRLVIGGLGNVFEIGKNFRNEGVDSSHSPEFMALEAYKLHSDYHDQARLIEGAFNEVWVGDNNPMDDVAHIDFFKSLNDRLSPWARVSPDTTVEELEGIIAALDMDIRSGKSGQMLEGLFDELVVPNLPVTAVFVYNYPTSTSPLAHARGDGTSEKWDLYVNRMELATGYTENTNPLIQEETLTEDQDFVHDVMYGMPPMGGLGMGIDRLVMLLTDSSHINQITAFPHSNM